MQLRVAQQGGGRALLHDGASVATQIEAVLWLATDAGKKEYGFRLYMQGDTLLFTDEWHKSAWGTLSLPAI